MSRRLPDPRWHDEQLLEALIPTPLPAPSPQPAPLPSLPPPATPDDADVLVDMARPDTAGRFTVHALLRALGWTAGLTLRVDVVHGAVLITPAADGPLVVGPRGELPLPAAARQLCGIAAGALVLVAAFPARHRIVVHPSNTITALLADLHTRILGEPR